MDELTPPDTPPPNSGAAKTPLNKSSAPIPVDLFVKPPKPTSGGLQISKDDMRTLEKQLDQDNKSRTVPVWLSDDSEGSLDGGLCLKDQTRWRRFAEHKLYTLFHYKQQEPTNGMAERKTWADYHAMNQKFANRILEIYKPGDIVMIHDYHLLLLPMMLRQKIPEMYISFFLHIPFPSSEFFRCLPRRKDVLEGVLGSNLIGFQSYNYLRHFVSCCKRILEFPSDNAGVDAYGAKVAVGVFPIGINAAAVEKKAFEDPAVDAKLDTLRNVTHKGKKIIVGRDRLDSVRGVAQKIMAFEKFFENFPEWIGKVVLLQVTSPTSIEEQKDDTVNKIANKVSELVQKVNGLYGSLDYAPIHHYPQFLPQAEYFALLRAGDVGLITSVRDGMNTTSLEYILCQRESHGPLILSEFSGTAGSLKDALQINPWNLSSVAKKINEALLMSEDKKTERHGSLYEHVTTRNVRAWSDSYIKRLLAVLNANNASVRTPVLDNVALLSQYKAAKKRLFMFDYDGTLTPIVRTPEAAVPSENLIRTLKALASDPRNAIWIISGRDQDFLGKHLGDIPELGFSAEHGSFMRHPGSSEWENLAETFDMSWQKEVRECFQRYTEKTPGKLPFISFIKCPANQLQAPSSKRSAAP